MIIIMIIGKAVPQGQAAARRHGHGRLRLSHGQHGQAPLRDHQGTAKRCYDSGPGSGFGVAFSAFW